MIRVELPAPLRKLAGIAGCEVELEVGSAATQGEVIDALEARYPMLRGTVRDPATGQRRAYVRFFACMEDVSHERMEAGLPERVLSGEEPLLIVGAVSGGTCARVISAGY